MMPANMGTTLCPSHTSVLDARHHARHLGPVCSGTEMPQCETGIRMCVTACKLSHSHFLRDTRMGHTKVRNSFPSLQVPPPNDLQMVFWGAVSKVVLGFRIVDMGCGPVWLLPFDKTRRLRPREAELLAKRLSTGVPMWAVWFWSLGPWSPLYIL